MKKLKRYYLISLISMVLFIAIGCSTDKKPAVIKIDGKINAEEVLRLDPSADIFQFNGVIYKTSVDWVNELPLTKDAQIGEIKTRNDKNKDFTNEMSNKLPVGAKIFSAKERDDILIVEFDGKTIKYLGIGEG
ncbi:MAG: hypothetical protein KKF57_08510 [Firmicutes bacterium]|nr:hypothetical protein [Bacillota bacterium]